MSEYTAKLNNLDGLITEIAKEVNNLQENGLSIREELTCERIEEHIKNMRIIIGDLKQLSNDVEK